MSTHSIAIDMRRCYATYPCQHDACVDGGISIAPSIVALHQLLQLPIDPHFNYVIDDSEMIAGVARRRNTLALRMGLNPPPPPPPTHS